MGKLASFLLLSAFCQIVTTAPIDSLKLKFRLSARDLPDKDDIGHSDPYLELAFTEEGKKEEVKLGKTSTLSDTGDPDWGETFDFDFVRSKRQRLILRLYDEDNLREDDNLGQAYIDVADFVDKSGHLTVNLNKKGYVIMDSLTPIVAPTTATTTSTTPKPAAIQIQNSTAPKIASSQPSSITGPQKLRFRLSAKDLPNKDKVGSSDPFVEILYTEGGSSKQKKLGVSSIIQESLNPIWNDIFEFSFDPTKAQKWFFEVRDSDEKGDSDGLGEVWVDVVDYVNKGQKVTVNLVKKGTLTIESIQSQTATTTTVKPPVPPPLPTKAASTPPPTRKLKFRLFVRNLEDKDLLGTSDPYIKVYSQRGSDQEVLLGNTMKFIDKEDADFPDVFEIEYNPAQKAKLRFLVLDEDDNRRDEELGNLSTDLEAYVKSGENLTLNLPNKGTLTVIKAN